MCRYGSCDGITLDIKNINKETRRNINEYSYKRSGNRLLF